MAISFAITSVAVSFKDAAQLRVLGTLMQDELAAGHLPPLTEEVAARIESYCAMAVAQLEAFELRKS